jgi:hypothetical protein
MTDNFPALSGGLSPAKLDRQTTRALVQIERSAAVARCQDRARIDRVATTTLHGMRRASQLGACEVLLAQATPQAAGYVHAVAVSGALGIVAIVQDVAGSA